MGTPIDVGSTVTTHLRLFYKDTSIATATGFFYRHAGMTFLITNWHVVTGRHFETLGYLDPKTAAIPDRIEYQVPVRGGLGEWIDVPRNLYADAEVAQPEKALWLEHPVHGHKLDVVAIPVTIPDDGEAFTIDRVDTVPKMMLTVSREVFVIGYPQNIVGRRGFPIWKRASIATEPAIPLDGMPKLLIDTATREGMSGAPVVAIADGDFDVEGAPPAYRKPGRVYRFLGIYSGRLGNDEMKAQLGIVWRSQVVGEIAAAGVPGLSSFAM